MVKILRKEGWVLNPNDKVVNSILKRCELLLQVGVMVAH